MRAARRLILPAALLAAAFVLGACAQHAAQAASGSDPKEIAIADQVMAAPGGQRTGVRVCGVLALLSCRTANLVVAALAPIQAAISNRR